MQPTKVESLTRTPPKPFGAASAGDSAHGATDLARRLCFRVSAADAGMRLDRFLAGQLGSGRRSIARLTGAVWVDGRRAAMGRIVAAGEEVTVELPRAPSEGSTSRAAIAERIVVAVKPEVVVLDKPRGLPTVSFTFDRKATLASELAARFPECAAIGSRGESGIAHRLDVETSGLVLAARSEAAYRALREQFHRHEIEKTYLALVWGTVTEPFAVDLPIGQHHKSQRRVQAIAEPGRARRYTSRAASTWVEPVGAIGPASLVRATTRTGARHQVRVHLAAAGHPLVGDRLYGDQSRDLRSGFTARHPGHWLHAAVLRWSAPQSGCTEAAELPMPADWNAPIATLRGLAKRD
jgi:23S rRNA pseudouridine1911/1915/1917 synthase